MAILETDLENINDLPSAGSLRGTTKFACQQPDAGDQAQNMEHSAMVVTGEIIGQYLGETIKSMTPDAFNKTNAKTTAYGTILLSSITDIANQAAGIKALTPEQIPQIMQSGIKQTGTLTNIDAATEGTVSNVNLYISGYGQMAKIAGSFTYVSNSNNEAKFIYINNAIQPKFTQLGSATFRTNSQPTIKRPISVYVSAEGAQDPLTRLGQIKIEINTGLDGLNFDTGEVYNITINIDYLSLI